MVSELFAQTKSQLSCFNDLEAYLAIPCKIAATWRPSKIVLCLLYHCFAIAVMILAEYTIWSPIDNFNQKEVSQLRLYHNAKDYMRTGRRWAEIRSQQNWLLCMTMSSKVSSTPRLRHLDLSSQVRPVPSWPLCYHRRTNYGICGGVGADDTNAGLSGFMKVKHPRCIASGCGRDAHVCLLWYSVWPPCWEHEQRSSCG